MAALLDEAKKNRWAPSAHLPQNSVAKFNADEATRRGLDTVTHYYGHFESLLEDKTIQEYRSARLQQRAGPLRRHRPALEPDLRARLEKWIEYLEHQKANHVTFDPTFNIYRRAAT